MNNKANILMVIYNVAKNTAKQIFDTINQFCQNWVLINRDDNSIDLTLRPVKVFEQKGIRIYLITIKNEIRNAFANFFTIV